MDEDKVFVIGSNEGSNLPQFQKDRSILCNCSQEGCKTRVWISIKNARQTPLCMECAQKLRKERKDTAFFTTKEDMAEAIEAITLIRTQEREATAKRIKRIFKVLGLLNLMSLGFGILLGMFVVSKKNTLPMLIGIVFTVLSLHTTLLIMIVKERRRQKNG